MSDLWFASVRPELAGMSDRRRLAVLLDEAADRFEARGLSSLAALCASAALELRQADREDERVKSLLGVGS